MAHINATAVLICILTFLGFLVAMGFSNQN